MVRNGAPLPVVQEASRTRLDCDDGDLYPTSARSTCARRIRRFTRPRVSDNKSITLASWPASWPSFVVDVARLAHLKTTVGELTPSLGKGRSTSPWLTRPNMAEAGRYGVPVPFRPAYPFSVLEKFRISQPLVNVVHQLVSRHF